MGPEVDSLGLFFGCHWYTALNLKLKGFQIPHLFLLGFKPI